MEKRKERILLCKPKKSGKEIKYIEEALAEDWMVPLGPNVDKFEEKLASFIGDDKKVAAVCSGTAALHLGLILLGVGHDDEVICQSLTFSATANPILYQGGVPVFVDSESQTWNMNPHLLREAIECRIKKTGKTPKAIIVVDLYGMPARLDEVVAVASEYGIPVLEDAAEALGSSYLGHKCGTWGALGAFSFNGNKMITTSGGGALICATEEQKRRALFFATQSREKCAWYQHEEIGYNYRLSNISAAIGQGQIEVLDEHIAHHHHVHKLYSEAFAGRDDIRMHCNPTPDFESNYWLCNAVLEKQLGEYEVGPDKAVMDMIAWLNEHNIESRPIWKPLHMQPVFAGCPAYTNGTGERIFRQGICLPAGPWVSDEDVAFIVDCILHKLDEWK